MSFVELSGHVDDNHKLNVELPVNFPSGPVRVLLRLKADDADDDSGSWARAIAQRWATEWSDPREDIYTLEDGEPGNEAG